MSRDITFTVATSDGKPVYVQDMTVGTDRGVVKVNVRKVVNATDTISVTLPEYMLAQSTPEES